MQVVLWICFVERRSIRLRFRFRFHFLLDLIPWSSTNLVPWPIWRNRKIDRKCPYVHADPYSVTLFDASIQFNSITSLFIPFLSLVESKRSRSNKRSSTGRCRVRWWARSTREFFLRHRAPIPVVDKGYVRKTTMKRRHSRPHQGIDGSFEIRDGRPEQLRKRSIDCLVPESISCLIRSWLRALQRCFPDGWRGRRQGRHSGAIATREAGRKLSRRRTAFWFLYTSFIGLGFCLANICL